MDNLEEIIKNGEQSRNKQLRQKIFDCVNVGEISFSPYSNNIYTDTPPILDSVVMSVNEHPFLSQVVEDALTYNNDSVES